MRQFPIHDHDHFILEQDISMHTTSTDDKWLGENTVQGLLAFVIC